MIDGDIYDLMTDGGAILAKRILVSTIYSEEQTKINKITIEE